MNTMRFLRSVTILAAMAAPSFAQIFSDHYAVILKDSPVAERFAGHEAMRSTAAEAYRRQIGTSQAAVMRQIRARNIEVVGSADVVLNAVFVSVAPERVAELKALPDVVEVVRLPYVHPHLNRAMQLMNAPAAWTALGGQSNA